MGAIVLDMEVKVCLGERDKGTNLEKHLSKVTELEGKERMSKHPGQEQDRH